jgi:threonine dehydrogenase-like Zn-dependent dehydrogenase
MRGLTFHGVGDVRVDDVDEPTVLAPGDAVVRVTLAGICGSDLHAYQAGDVFGFLPGIRLGHEFIGTVEAVGGDVRRVRPGDRVLAAVLAACGRCAHCAEGLPSSCPSRSSFGWAPRAWRSEGEIQGAQSEMMRVPFADATLDPMPEALAGPEHEASLLPVVDVLSTAWHGLRRAGVKAGDAVVVIGDGAVGLSAVHGASALDAAPIVSLGHHPDRLAVAERLGATATVSSRDADEIREGVLELTGGMGAHVVIDTVASQTSMETAFACVRAGGTIATMGMEHFKAGTLSVNWVDQYLRNVTITGGYVPGKRYFPELLPLVEAGRLEPSPLLTHRLPLDDAPDAYRMMAERVDGVIKVAVAP